MIKLKGKTVYLTTLKKEDCHKLWQESEYNFDNPTESPPAEYSAARADEWFDQITQLQLNTNIRLGVFLHSGEVIGDIALQDIDRTLRSCSIGLGFSKFEYRGKGYGKEALRLMLDYAFGAAGMERVTARIWKTNAAAQKILEYMGFVLKDTEFGAVTINGKIFDKLLYSLSKNGNS